MAIRKAMLLFFAIMAFTHCIAIAGTPKTEPTPEPVLEQHQKCRSDNECMLTQRQCSDCDCGTPINLKYNQIYQEEKKLRCESYKGPVCDLICPTNKAECRSGKCIEKEIRK